MVDTTVLVRAPWVPCLVIWNFLLVWKLICFVLMDLTDRAEL